MFRFDARTIRVENLGRISHFLTPCNNTGEISEEIFGGRRSADSEIRVFWVSKSTATLKMQSLPNTSYFPNRPFNSRPQNANMQNGTLQRIH